MPQYRGISRNGKALFIGDDLTRAGKWLRKNDLKWITVDMDLVEGQEDPKTAEQTGYYWGLLHPEIHKQMLTDGVQETITYRGMTIEIPITRKGAHEIITAASGHIGEDGAFMRLSDCDKDHCRKWIDNVLDFAGKLCMNTDKLKAVRDKL